MRFFLLILALFFVLPASGQTPAIHFRNVNREVGIPMPGAGDFGAEVHHPADERRSGTV
jgi:hypothetical protein